MGKIIGKLSENSENSAEKYGKTLVKFLGNSGEILEERCMHTRNTVLREAHIERNIVLQET